MCKNFLLLISLFLCHFYVQAQYTTTINSNRPGNSQGAFSVGTGVLQLESGITYGQDNHELLMTESTLYGVDYAVRYGFLFEELEVSWIGSFLYDETEVPVGASINSYTQSNFNSNTLGAKYLVYDPYKHEDASKINIHSWKANRKFKFRKLIPAVSVYAGVNIMLGDNPFKFENESTFSPKVTISTQNNWGRWVFVTNIIGDKITEDMPTYAGIFTMTHSVSPRFAVFGEYQVLMSDFYSDNIARAGAAYLFSRNFQIDISALTNFKDTPERWQVATGLSYRFDFHSEDKFVEDKNKTRELEEEKKRFEETMDVE